jgi:hypothetical protein
VGLLSIIVNGVGAIEGAMYCDLANHAFWPHLSLLRRGEWGTFPLFSWLFIPTVMCVYTLVKLLTARDTRPIELSATAPRSKSSG